MIFYKNLETGELETGPRQVCVRFDGSVAVLPFEINEAVNGQAVLLLEDHAEDWPGEPGRPTPERMHGERDTMTCPGVALTFTDPRSIRAVIQNLEKLETELKQAQGWDMCANTPPKDWVSSVDHAIGPDRAVLMVCERVEGVVQLVDHCDLLDREAVDAMLARCRLSRVGIEWLKANLGCETDTVSIDDKSNESSQK